MIKAFLSAILVVFGYLFAFPSVRAATSVPVAVDVVSTTNSTVSAEQKNNSEYALPYPGILPDHPLYFLKEFRDRIIELLIADQARKSEFYLLQADKFIASAQALVEKGQSESANVAIVRASERLKLSVDQLTAMKSTGRQIQAGSIDTMERAISKHIEVLQQLSSTVQTASVIASLQQLSTDVSKLK